MWLWAINMRKWWYNPEGWFIPSVCSGLRTGAWFLKEREGNSSPTTFPNTLGMPNTKATPPSTSNQGRLLIAKTEEGSARLPTEHTFFCTNGLLSQAMMRESWPSRAPRPAQTSGCLSWQSVYLQQYGRDNQTIQHTRLSSPGQDIRSRDWE